MGGYLYTIGTIQYLILFISLLIFIYLIIIFYFTRREQHENKTEFKGNNIPYEYAAGADVSDSINGNPLSHFHLK